MLPDIWKALGKAHISVSHPYVLAIFTKGIKSLSPDNIFSVAGSVVQINSTPWATNSVSTAFSLFSEFLS